MDRISAIWFNALDFANFSSFCYLACLHWEKDAINFDRLLQQKTEFNRIIIQLLYYYNIFHRMNFGHTLDDSRKKYPEITDELLDNLQKWAKDRGLPKIPEQQLALFAHSCYFDLEATKRCMNVYYRMRSTVPEFFSDRDSSLDYLQHSLKVAYVLISIS